ncbi:MAG: hypothetical protein ICV83_29200, partial [Cytophagales bacterium]|nr:hypothetical protein [Cytophagales bacterium]
VLTTLAEEVSERHPGKAGAYQERADELQMHVERIRQVLMTFNDLGATSPEAPVN